MSLLGFSLFKQPIRSSRQDCRPRAVGKTLADVVRFLIVLFASLLWIPAVGIAAETPRLAFVSEYIRELAANEDMRARGEKDIAEAGADKNVAAIRSSTRIILELTSQISNLKGMTLDAPFDKLPGLIAGYYGDKIDVHNRMIAIATAFASGPKPDVDYGAMLAEAPKLTATQEYIDRSLFEVTPLIFEMLVADEPDKNGHMSHLSVTRAQRDDLLRKLQISFDNKMDQKDQNYIVSSATVLRSALSNKGYKCSDEPWE